jgi:hypothetical protein
LHYFFTFLCELITQVSTSLLLACPYFDVSLWIRSISFSKALTTPSPVFELTYIHSAPNFSAQLFPSSIVTCLSAYKSNFAPTSTLEQCSGAESSICVSHLPIFLKDLLSVME